MLEITTNKQARSKLVLRKEDRRLLRSIDASENVQELKSCHEVASGSFSLKQKRLNRVDAYVGQNLIQTPIRDFELVDFPSKCRVALMKMTRLHK
jgi:hypothetical protein